MTTQNDFSWLIFPTTRQKFFDDYLEQQPLILQRSEPDYFKRLIDIQNIDNLLILGQTLGNFDIRLEHPDETIDIFNYTQLTKINNVFVKTRIHVDKIISAFEEKHASISMDSVQNVLPEISDFLSNIDREIGCKTDTNIRISPANSPPFLEKYNTWDQFVLQIHGKKHWRIYENLIELPLGFQRNIAFQLSELKCLHDVILESGDLIYIPRGFVYRSFNSEEPSVELNVLCSNITWTNLLINHIRQASHQQHILRHGFMVEKLRMNSDRHRTCEKVKRMLLESLTFENLEKVKSGMERTTNQSEQMRVFS